jgi:cytidylate kinase
MSYNVVCFSGPDGAEMREVAASVAGSLGFSVVDEAIIMRAAAEASVDPSVVADVEKRRSFIDRALTALSASGDATAMMFSGGTGGYLETERPVSDELRNLIRVAIEETAARSDVVIVAHAASHALAEQENALRVLVTASTEARRARVAAEQGLSEKDAARVVAESDANRADYLRRFFGEKTELPTHYDVVVNTDRLSAADAAAIVMQAATQRSTSGA